MVLVLALALVVPLASASSGPSKTEVISWSPFDATSQIKRELRVKTMPTGQCPAPDSEETVFLYRCVSGNFLLDPCWQDGPHLTDFAVCAIDPWSPTVYRLRAPHFLLDAGVTWDRDLAYPWGVELANGSRCVLTHGAHSTVPTPHGEQVIDYYCPRNIVLLRNLRRGRVWTIGAAHYAHGHYKLAGRLALRRVYFDALWARVQFFNFSGAEDKYAVLHFAGGRWVETREFRPYCQKLPAEVRTQLFTPKECGGSSRSS
jgi:hypothetical protein